jgi:hypothetical protein
MRVKQFYLRKLSFAAAKNEVCGEMLPNQRDLGIKSCFSGRNNVIRREHISFKHKFTLTRKKNTWAIEMLTDGKQLRNETL